MTPLLAIDCRTGLIRRWMRHVEGYKQLKVTDEFQMDVWPPDGEMSELLSQMRLTPGLVA